MASVLPSELAVDLLKRGHHVRLRAEGGSMRPWITSGKTVLLLPVDDKDCLAPGQVVFALCDGRPTLHRIVRVQPMILMKGDALGHLDPVPAEIWGRLERSGGKGDRLIAYFSLALLPLQSLLIRFWCLLRARRYGKSSV
jgi:hypothetical protein